MAGSSLLGHPSTGGGPPLPTHHERSPVRKLFGIQYLRALAAMAVVTVHVANRYDMTFPAGLLGVDLFFIISGVLMVAVTSPETRAAGFLRDRIVRIVPIYWLATSVMLAGGLAHLFPTLRLEAWHVAASYLFLPAPSPNGGQLWPLLVPGWTLNYEMAFYTVFALLLRLRRPVAMLATMSAAFLALALFGAALPLASPAARFYTNPIILEFVMGGWIGLYWKEGHRWPRAAGVPLLLAGLAVLVLVLAMRWPLPHVVAAGLPLSALVTAVLALERRSPVPRIAPLALLGDASYSVYIWHGLVISIAVTLLAKLHVGGAAAPLVTYLVALAAGVASYLVLERPLMAFFRARRRRPRTFDPIGKGMTVAPR